VFANQIIEGVFDRYFSFKRYYSTRQQDNSCHNLKGRDFRGNI